LASSSFNLKSGFAFCELNMFNLLLQDFFVSSISSSVSRKYLLSLNKRIALDSLYVPEYISCIFFLDKKEEEYESISVFLFIAVALAKNGFLF